MLRPIFLTGMFTAFITPIRGTARSRSGIVYGFWTMPQLALERTRTGVPEVFEGGDLVAYYPFFPMKFISTLIVLVVACAIALNAQAFTNEETNSVALSILAYASMDNEDDLDAEADYPVRYTTWNGLLDSVSLPGWTRGAKDALYVYLKWAS